jgi:signal transduction histidine kinase
MGFANPTCRIDKNVGFHEYMFTPLISEGLCAKRLRCASGITVKFLGFARHKSGLTERPTPVHRAGEYWARVLRLPMLRYLDSSTQRSSTSITRGMDKKRVKGASLFWIAVLSGMVALLVIVAVLQYRWTTQVTEATDARIGSDLQSLMMDWHYDLYRELSAICVTLQVGPDSGARDNWQDYLQRYSLWNRSTDYEAPVEKINSRANFVENVYIWETSRARNPRLLRLNAQANKIEDDNIPAKLKQLLARLEERSSSVPVALRAWELTIPTAETQRANEPLSASNARHSDPITGWQFDPNVPAIVHPIIHQRNVSDQVVNTEARGRLDWIVVLVDLQALRERTLPDLTKRYFETRQGLEYKVTIATGVDSRRVVYSSDPQSAYLANADASMNIFGPPPESGGDHSWQVFTAGNSLKSAEWHSFSGPVWFHTIQYTAGQDPWVLILQHRNGPLEAVVKEIRSRNIMIGGIVLLLLTADMGLIVIASRRAQKLAKLQLNFVASVSHELLTPLAAIYCTGQNAMDGLVQAKADLIEHGSIITSQARQLIDLVKQILLFASAESGTNRYSLRPLEVSEILQCVRKNVAVLVGGAGFKVEEEVQAELPFVMGDLTALSQCLQNLIANAVKYSGKSRWIGISASVQEARNRQGDVWISVQDRGLGISSEDLPHIFEPFYRSPKIVDAQIHGTGLGLAVAKRIAEAMGGILSVTSEVGVGSTFTLHLRAAERWDARISEPAAFPIELEVKK